ncbi:hypothetical protein C8261_00005 [Pseudothauera lacus]|uniref:MAPEG family protein n=2 Tax=Pseudothauera lacus TaxID=2136175 RepID=A0A2T4IJA5_9RHOO|nr:hypothetical protein C8261_00005 [Pseudothauera lacus]
MLVLVQVPIRRFRAVFAGRVTAADFEHGESATVPVDVSRPNRVFINLVEVPTLFYALCIIHFVTGTVTVTVTALTMAWVYFALRIAHSLIYLTYNRVFHRFLVFATSNVLLVVMTVLLAVALAE